MPESSDTSRLEAIDHLDSEGLVVKSAHLFADAVLRQLRNGKPTTASFQGLRGASSSYFNVFLQRMADDGGLSEIGSRLLLHFGTPVQQSIFNRSLDALRFGTTRSDAPVIGND